MTEWYSDEEVHAFMSGACDDQVTELRAFAVSYAHSESAKPIAQMFRDSHLSGRTLPPDEALQWMESAEQETSFSNLAAREVAATLSKAFDWSVDQATHYILTDKVPKLKLLHYSIRHGKHPPLTTILLQVNLLVRPEEVEQAYRQARSEASGGRRLRRQSPKHLRLATLYGYAGNKMLKQWNQYCPEGEAYSSRRDFKRDVLHARKRLLGEEE
jgi:hypothetical protein